MTVACHWFLFLANCTLYEVHIVTSRFYHTVWCVSSRALICSSITQTVHSRQALRNFSCPHACNMPHPCCHSLLFTCLAYLFNRLRPSPWGRVSLQSSIAGTLAMIWSRLEAWVYVVVLSVFVLACVSIGLVTVQLKRLAAGFIPRGLRFETGVVKVRFVLKWQ